MITGLTNLLIKAPAAYLKLSWLDSSAIILEASIKKLGLSSYTVLSIVYSAFYLYVLSRPSKAVWIRLAKFISKYFKF